MTINTNPKREKVELGREVRYQLPPDGPLDRATLLRIEALRAAMDLTVVLIRSRELVRVNGKVRAEFDPVALAIGYAEELEAYLAGNEKETGE